jgi:hypothetical protein
MNEKDALLEEFDALMDAVETTDAVWALGDWLVANVPSLGQGRPSKTRPESGFPTLKELAARRDITEGWLQTIRSVAEQTQPARLADVSVRTYQEALKNRTLREANALLRRRGKRLRDVSGPMESLDAVEANLKARTPKQQAAIVKSLVEDPDVATAVATEIAGTDAGQTISVHEDLHQAARMQKATKAIHDKGGETLGERDAREFVYDTIGDRAFNIYLQTQAIARAIAGFTGKHDEEEVARAIERLEAAEYLIRQTREALVEVGSIDMDDLMADIQSHLNEAKQ